MTDSALRINCPVNRMSPAQYAGLATSAPVDEIIPNMPLLRKPVMMIGNIIRPTTKASQGKYSASRSLPTRGISGFASRRESMFSSGTGVSLDVWLSDVSEWCVGSENCCGGPAGDCAGPDG